MSFDKPLTVGKTHLLPGTIRSVVRMENRLVIDSGVGYFVLEGDRLEHCFIDFIHGRCTRIEEVPGVPSYPLAWHVRKIATVGKMPLPTGAIEPFEGRLTDGWLLYELPKAWHLWPLKSLRAIGYRRDTLFAIIDDWVVELDADTAQVVAEFVAFATGAVTARHSTQRALGDYLGLLPVTRFYATRIRIRPFDADRGLHALRLTKQHCFDQTLNISRGRHRPGPER